MTFLSVVTRHIPQRAELLKRNKASLKSQTDPDFHQVLMVDELSRGWQHAHTLLSDASYFVKGQYVLILDDDDEIQDADAIEALKFATETNPAIVIFRGAHADLGILPSYSWGQSPKQGDIGCFDFILRADVFKEMVRIECSDAYAHDFAIISAAFEKYASNTIWLDRVLCVADKRRIGAVA